MLSTHVRYFPPYSCRDNSSPLLSPYSYCRLSLVPLFMSHYSYLLLFPIYARQFMTPHLPCHLGPCVHLFMSLCVPIYRRIYVPSCPLIILSSCFLDNFSLNSLIMTPQLMYLILKSYSCPSVSPFPFISVSSYPLIHTHVVPKSMSPFCSYSFPLLSALDPLIYVSSLPFIHVPFCPRIHISWPLLFSYLCHLLSLYSCPLLTHFLLPSCYFYIPPLNPMSLLFPLIMSHLDDSLNSLFVPLGPCPIVLLPFCPLFHVLFLFMK